MSSIRFLTSAVISALFLNLPALAADGNFTITAPLSNANDYNNVTIAVPSSSNLESGFFIGGYVYLSGTIDGNINFTNEGSITSNNANSGVLALPNIGHNSQNRTVSLINIGDLIATGQFADTIKIIAKNDGDVARSFDFSLDNSGNIIAALSQAIRVDNGSSGTFEIENSGEISNSEDGGATISLTDGTLAIISNTGNIQTSAVEDDVITVDQASVTINNNDSGSIRGRIVGRGDSNSTLTINNYDEAIITGDITTTSSDLDLLLDSSSINGDINLGNNASSSITVNGGGIVGNISMNNVAQIINLNGGAIEGEIDGAGNININSNLTTKGNIGGNTALTSISIAENVTLNAADFNNSINATNITLRGGAILEMSISSLTATVDGSEENVGTVNFNLDGDLDLEATLGASNGLAAVNFTNTVGNQVVVKELIKAAEVSISGIDAVLTLDEGISVNGNVVIGDNSTFYLRNNSSVNGEIRGFSDGGGIFQLENNATFTTSHNIGTESHGIGNFSIGDNSTFTTSAALRSSSISLGSDAILNSSGEIIGAVEINDGAVLNLNDGASVNGSINSGGIVEVGTVNTFGEVELRGSLGAQGPLGTINIANGSQARIGNNDNSHENTIEAINFNITGAVFLLDATTIRGAVTMIGANSKIDFGGYSQLMVNNFTTAAGSTLAASIHSSTVIDKLTIEGVATIAAQTKLDLSVGDAEVGNSYVLIEGGNGSTINTISAANINVDNSNTNRVGRYVFSTIVDGDNLILSSILKNLTTTNANRSAIYNTIADAHAGGSGALYNFQNYLFSEASSSEKNQVLDSAMPQIDNSTNRILFNLANNSFDLSTNRLQNLYAAKAEGKSYAANSLFGSDAVLDEENKNAFWSQVFASNINQGNNGISQGYNANIQGIIFGADKKIDQNLYLGISASYASADTKSRDQLKQTNIDSYQVNLYSGHIYDNFFINNLVGFAWNNYKSRRAIPVAAVRAAADYSGQNYIARIESGYHKKFQNDFIFTPSLIVTAARNAVGNYSEDGAGTLSLSTQTKSSDFFETRLNLSLKTIVTLKNFTIEPEIFTSYGHDFASSKQQTTNNFIGQSTTFDATSNNLSRGSLKTGIAAKLYQKDSLTFDLNYTYEKRENYNANAVGVRGVYKF